MLCEVCVAHVSPDVFRCVGVVSCRLTARPPEGHFALDSLSGAAMGTFQDWFVNCGLFSVQPLKNRITKLKWDSPDPPQTNAPYYI